MQAHLIHLPRLAAPRYRALGFVVLVHLALGWWLMRGVAPLELQLQRSPLAPVLIQNVQLGSPATDPQQQSQSPQPPQAVHRQPVSARSALRAEPVPPAAPAVREVLPAAQGTPPNPTPMASRVLPSAEPVSAPAAVAAATGQPASLSAAMSSAAPATESASNPARSGSSAISQPTTGVSSGSASSTGAASTDMALVCPTQVAPVTPRLAVRGGITGVVLAQAVIVDGVVRDVRILSGAPVFHNAVRTAMRQYRCVSNRAEVLATQEFVFRFE